MLETRFDSWVGKSCWRRERLPTPVFLVAQLVMNPSAMQETSVQSLGREDPLKRGKATHCSVLVWRIPWTVHGVAKSRTGLSTFHFHSGSPSQNRITRGPEPLLKGLAQQVDSAVILTRHKLLVQLITEELNFCSLIKGVLLSPRKQKV